MKTKFKGILTLLLALVAQVAFAQQTVTGTVTDPNGDPIFGAVVTVKGNSDSNATTDFDGKYSIQALPSNTLVFQSAGYEVQEIVVGSKSVINVDLKSSLDVAVIVGYRSVKPETSTAATSTVTSATIENRPNASIVQTLTGQVAGLSIITGTGQPGANSLVQLRGISSINGDTEPLFIMDGSPVDQDNFRSLNPQDIDSISILKDASATAIYGNRGANGVIVITTKKGRANTPMTIQLSSIQSFTTLQGNDYNFLNAQELLTLERDFGNGVGAQGFPGGTAGPLTDAQIAGAANQDWVDYFFRTGVATNNNVSITSGGKNNSQYTSLGFFDQEGALVDSDLKRFNIRTTLTGNSDNKRFNYQVTLNGNYSTSNEPGNIGTGAVNRNFVLGAYVGVPYVTPADYQNADQLTARTGSLQALFRDTPLLLIDRLNSFKRREEEVRALSSARFSYKLTDDLTVSSTSGIDFTETLLNQQENGNSWNANRFRGGAALNTAGRVFRQFGRTFTFNQLTSLNYNKTFAEKHEINGGLYTEYFKAHFDGLGFDARGGNILLQDFGDGAGFLPDVAANDFYIDVANQTRRQSGLFSYFGSLDYNYDAKYGVSATIRRDASSRFSRSNRWGTFYSVGGFWNIHKEGFYGEGNTVNSLKLRASYGRTGNQDVNNGGLFGGLTLTQDLFGQVAGYQGVPGLAATVFGVSDLRWETTTGVNIGVDFEMFNSRLRGAVDVYSKDTDDLFQNRPISGTVGTRGYSLAANVGSLNNTGIDFELKYDVVPRNFDNPKAFAFNISLNGNFVETILTDIPSTSGFIDGIGRVDGRIFEQLVVRYAGVNPANGQLLFLDANGDLTESPNSDTDRVWNNKSFTPEFQGGFALNFDYKNFFLQTQFNYATGIDRFDFDLANTQDPSSIGQFNVGRDILRAWETPGQVTDIPSLRATNLDFASDRYLRDSDYLRLRFVSLGYSFDQNQLSTSKIRSLRIFANAENLLTVSKWRGFDASAFNGTYTYPTARIVSFGIELGI